MEPNKPFDPAQGKPFDTTQGKPFDTNQAKPFDTNQAKPFDTAQSKPFDASQSRSNYQSSIGSVPPPPQNEVSVRTLASDVASIQQQGGGAPVAEKVSPLEMASTTMTSTMPVAAKHSMGRWWLVVLAVVVVAGLGYYYFFFMRTGQGPTTTQTTPTTETSPAPTATSEIDYPALLAALQGEASQPLPAGTAKEVALVNEQNQVISFSKLLSLMLPETAGSDFATTIPGNFEDAFKAYLYYDEQGVWPVYSVHVKSDAALDAVSLQAKLRGIENALLTNFYLAAPGAPAGEFKDGQVKGFPTRYLSFSQPGASFNYGLINGQLYLSTSYNALKSLVQ